MFWTIIPNPAVVKKNVETIINYIEEAGEGRFEKGIFLYNGSRLEELKSVLDFFVFWVGIKSQYKLYLNKNYKEDQAMQLKVFPPKNVEILKVKEQFADLNKELLKKLGLSVNDNEKKERIKNCLFVIQYFNSENNKSIVLSFYPSVQTIEVLLNKLNKIIFGDEPNQEFFDVETIKIEQVEEAKPEYNLLFN